MKRVRARVVLALCAGLLAASQSGNIVRLGEAHPVAIAAWRLLIASLLMAVLAGRKLCSVRVLSKGDAILLTVSGLALALHFFSWIAAVQNTTVANAAICFSINPVITALAARLIFNEPITSSLMLSVFLGIVGVGVLGLGDLGLGFGQLKGDALAILSSFLFTLYFLPGRRLRQFLDIRTYVAYIYGFAGIAGFIVMGITGIPFVEYDARTWVCFLAMAFVPTMIGHTGLNYALKYLPAGVVSALTLVEPAFAGIVALLAWGEQPGTQTFIAYGFTCASVLVLVRGQGFVVSQGR